MPIASCNTCQQRFQAKEKLAGKKVKCPRCNAVILIPGVAVKAAPAPVQPQVTPIPMAPRPVTPPVPMSSAVPDTPVGADLTNFLDEEIGAAHMQQMQAYQNHQMAQLAAQQPNYQTHTACGSCRAAIPKQVTVCPYCGKGDALEDQLNSTDQQSSGFNGDAAGIALDIGLTIAQGLLGG